SLACVLTPRKDSKGRMRFRAPNITPGARKPHQATTASTSRADRISRSSPPCETSVPPYLLKMILSPTATSSGTRLPLSSTRPGPTAMTSPSCGFSLAVSGITSPDAVVCSASTVLMTIRSSSGLMVTDTCRPPLSTVNVVDTGVVCRRGEHSCQLALTGDECQSQSNTLLALAPSEC